MPGYPQYIIINNNKIIFKGYYCRNKKICYKQNNNDNHLLFTHRKEAL